MLSPAQLRQVNPSNNALENLLLVCASCHSKITGGVLSKEEISRKKRELKENLNPDSPRLKINAVLEARDTDKREIVLVIPVVNVGRRPVFVSRVAVILEPRETSVMGNPLIKFTPASSELTAHQKNATVKIEPDGDRHVWQIALPRPADFKVVERDGERYGSVHVELTSGDRVEREFLLLPDSAWNFIHAPIAPVFDGKAGYKCPRCGFVFLLQVSSQSGGVQSSVTCPQCKHISSSKPL